MTEPLTLISELEACGCSCAQKGLDVIRSLKGVEPKQEGWRDIEGDQFATLANDVMTDVGLDGKLQGHDAANVSDKLAVILRALISPAHAKGLLAQRSYLASKQEVAGASGDDEVPIEHVVAWQRLASVVKSEHGHLIRELEDSADKIGFQRGFEACREMARAKALEIKKRADLRDRGFTKGVPYTGVGTAKLIAQAIYALTPNTDREDGMAELQRLGQEWDAAPAKGEEEIVKRLRGRAAHYRDIKAPSPVDMVKSQDFGRLTAVNDSLKAQVEKLRAALKIIEDEDWRWGRPVPGAPSQKIYGGRHSLIARTALAQTEGE